ncbi:TetR/AcrR family transcriptional regulator [Ruegeria sp. MALMAid1280]|uniref:TetR/AcrR family transcriptional regulator n=1 Tax=Ruegeria sp. MALMAid1280 TaxID=3411634 RepID=UPI003BA23265
MARPQNREALASNREKLLNAGEHAMRSKSYGESGINEILTTAGVPKGSFYHYFDSKEAFGIEVARRYHQRQVEYARNCLDDITRPPVERLRSFFEGAREDMKSRQFAQGCLMCNLSTELADERPNFQTELDAHWTALVAELSKCLDQADLSDIGLQHLTPDEAADWLLNAWSGALTRMKASGNDKPLALFMHTIFKTEETKP